MKKEINSNSQIVLYKAEDGKSSLEIKLKDENIWLTQKHMAEIFDKDYKAISKHIGNIFKENELSRNRTVSFFETVQKEGNRDVIRKLEYYNLDMIISVGYRVNSKRDTQFRIWATDTLKQHLVQGYTINAKRLKEQSNKILELQETVNYLSQTAESLSFSLTG